MLLELLQITLATSLDPGYGVRGVANRFDPHDSIRFAGQYMAALHAQLGSWQRALAGYDWGPGYVLKYPQSAWPTETKNYVAEITADVPV